MSVFQTKPEQKVKLYEIAAQMKQAGLPDLFIAGAVEIASYYEGAFNLFELWVDESDQEERDELISALQEEINEYIDQPRKPTKKPYIKYSDLELIARDVKSFKEHLKTLVDQWGGINKLSRVAKIPQPSLSRFFSSTSMPRRTTLYKIADALGLSEREIITEWAA